MAKFFSKCSNQVMTMTPAYKTVQNGFLQQIAGERIAFVDSHFETEDEKVIEFLRSHSLIGRGIVEVSEDLKSAKDKKATKEETKTEV